MSGGGTNTVTQSAQPPAAFLNAYSSLLSRATGVANQPLQQYGGPMVAGFTPQQQQGFDAIGNSQGIADPYINSAAGEIGQATAPIPVAQFSPGAVGQYESPFTKDVVHATEGEFNDQNAQQREGITGNAIAKGAFGGDREGVAQGILAGEQQRAQAPVIAGLENQGYSQALGEFNQQQGTQLGATEAQRWLESQGAFGLAGLGSEAENTSLEGANALLGAGGMQQSLAQEQLNIPYEQFLQAQAYPFQTTQFLGGLAEGLGGASGGTSSTTQPGPDTMSSVLGAGLGLAGIGSLTGAFGSAGWLAALKRGGGVPRRAAGGILPTVPDLSMSFVPNVSAMRGSGPPRAPAPVSQHDPAVQGMDFMREAAMLGRAANRNTRGQGILGRDFGGQADYPGAGIDDIGLADLSSDAMANVGAGAAGLRRGGGIVAFRRPQHRGSGGIAGSFKGGNGVDIPMLALSGTGGGGHVDTRPTSFFSPPPLESLPVHTVAGTGGPPAAASPSASLDQMNTNRAALGFAPIGDPTQEWLAAQAANVASAGGGGGARRGGGIMPRYDDGGEVEDDMVMPDEGTDTVPLSSLQEPAYDAQAEAPESQDYRGAGVGGGYTPRQPSGRSDRASRMAPALALLAASAGILGDRHPGNIGRGIAAGIGTYAHQQQAADQMGEREDEQRDTGAYRQASLEQHADEFSKHLDVTREGIKQRGQQLANQAEHQAAQMAETSRHNQAQEGTQSTRAANEAAYQAGELKARNRATDVNEQYRRDLVDQGRFQWKDGPGPDPDDPTKKTDGSWRYPTRGDDEPKFYPGVTSTPRAGAGGRGAMTAQLAHELMQPGPNGEPAAANDLPSALSMIKDPSGARGAQVDLAKDRMAQSAARAEAGQDLTGKTKMQDILPRWRQFYGVGGQQQQQQTPQQRGDAAAPAWGSRESPFSVTSQDQIERFKKEAPPGAVISVDGKLYVK